MEEEEKDKSPDWKKFVRRHWNIVAIFVIAGIVAVSGAVYVFWWFVGEAQSTGLVPLTLNLWAMENVVMFILHAIFWEVILIGIPVAIGAIAGWQWWKKLPDEEKKEYRLFGKHSRTTSGGSGVSILFFIAFAIKVYVDGNWNNAISSWTVNYVIGSMITILIWSAIIFGIPAAIGVIWWIHHETKIPSENENT
ncbi:MAG: hypothetical protein NWF00_02650 [Candidatus Bathyarchaeota archaeon]|nr:hypothetical protein [Candidatus Bathyarchaeota archaeon]